MVGKHATGEQRFYIEYHVTEPDEKYVVMERVGLFKTRVVDKYKSRRQAIQWATELNKKHEVFFGDGDNGDTEEDIF